MLSHLIAHRERREHERKQAENAKMGTAYRLILRAAIEPSSLTPEEWVEVSWAINATGMDPEWLDEKLHRAALIERELAGIAELLPRKRMAQIRPHGFDSQSINEQWSRLAQLQGELESIARAIPALVPRPAPLPDPLAV